MSRVFVSEGIGAGIYVFSDDHCPPHVHAQHRGDGWIARVGFSYVTSVVELISIAPVRNIPLQRVVNQLLDDVEAHLAICRRSWWEIRRTACLVNQWATIQKSGKMEISAANVAGAKQITDAEYDSDLGRLNVIFRDGTTAELEA
jgi:hypothetical protein